MKLKKYFEKFLYLYCQIIIFFCCAHPYLTVSDSYVAPMLLFGILSLVLYVILFRNIKSLNNKSILLLLFGIVLSLIYNDLSDLSIYFRLFLAIIYSYLVVNLLNFKVVAKHFIHVMTLICIISLVGYILVNRLGVINLPTMININDVSYGNGIIYFYIKHIKIRNCGIFWEPGLFASFILFNLLLNYICFDNKYKFNIIICLITMLTVNSSAGYLLSVFYLCLLLYSKVRNKNDAIALILKFLFIPIVFVVLTVFYYSISVGSLSNNEFFKKLQYDNFMSSYRMQAIEFNLKLFLENIFLGTGIIEYYNLAPKLMCPDTSTSTMLLSIFGVFGAIYTIIILINTFRLYKISVIEKIIILFIILMIVNKEPHYNMTFSWLFILGLCTIRGDKQCS